MATKIVRVVTPDETVEFEESEVVIRHTQEGVSITPSATAEDSTLGFLRLFFPWSEVRQIKEFIRG